MRKWLVSEWEAATHLFHVLGCLCRCLHERQAVCLCKSLSLRGRNLSFVWQVCLVADEHDGDVLAEWRADEGEAGMHTWSICGSPPAMKRGGQRSHAEWCRTPKGRLPHHGNTSAWYCGTFLVRPGGKWCRETHTVSQICSLIGSSSTVIVREPNSTPIVSSCTDWKRLSVNWRSRQDLPTAEGENQRQLQGVQRMKGA